MTGAQHSPSLLWVTASLETNAGSSLAAPVPLLILLSNQPVDSSSSPASAHLLCPLVKSQETPQEHMLVQHPALCHVSPFPPLAFSLRLQRFGRDQGRLGPLPIIHTAYPSPSHKGKRSKKQKNLLYRDIFLLYKVCTVPKKERKKKGVNFFSLS